MGTRNSSSDKKPERKRPGRKPETLKIDLDPEEGIRRLLAPKPPAKHSRKSGSASQ